MKQPRRRERPWMRYERWVITFCIVIVALLVLAAIGYLTGRWDISPTFD